MRSIDIPQQTLDLLAFRIDGDEPWGAPEELKFDLPVVAPFKPELLPEVLSTYVGDVAHRMQCPPDFVAVACLVMFGSIVGSGCGVRPKQKDDWTEHPNLWGGIIGRPGALKTPALSAGMLPMAYLDDDARRKHSEAMAAYTARKVDRDFELRALKADKSHTKLNITEKSARNRMVELTLADEEQPRLRRYRTNDATVEVIGEISRHNPRGLLVFRDELIGLLASCDKQGHEGDRSFYLEAWVGRNTFAVDRIGRGSIVISRLCLSLFGGIQPSKLQEYIYGTVSGMDNDGLLQRFQLMVYPDDDGTWQYVDEVPDAQAIEDITKIARTLADTDFVSLGAQRDGESGVPYFRFTPAAQKLFIQWLTGLEASLPKQENPVIAEHLAKYRKLIPALALIFHLVDLASGKRLRTKGISKEAIELAIAWGKYLQTHALRIYSMALDPVQPAVSTLAAKIKVGKLQDGFSERDVYKAEWANLKDTEVVQAACRELEIDGWIRRIPFEKGNGRPPSPSYNINPALKVK